MLQIPQLTGVPKLVNTNVSSTLDFHILTTNFIKVVDLYGDYVSLFYIWNKTKSAPDVITAQAEFFRKLNNSEFNLATDKTATINSTLIANPDLYFSYDLMELNVLLLPSEIWIRSSSGLPEKREEGTGSTKLIHYLAYNISTGNERWVLGPDIQSIATNTRSSDCASLSDAEHGSKKVFNKLCKLRDGVGAQNMEEEFLLYWYQMFNQSHSEVKKAYKLLIGDDDTQNYFTEFSDSIGTLQRTIENVDCNIIPIIDIEFDLFNTFPSITPPSVFDKVDNNTKKLLLTSSKSVNALFRSNIIRVVESISSPDQAHKDNLITDYLHWGRMSKSIGLMSGIVSDTLGATYKLLSYIQLAQNNQNSVSPIFNVVVEGSKIEVDYLKNKIQTLSSSVSNSRTIKRVLKAETMDFAGQD